MMKYRLANMNDLNDLLRWRNQSTVRDLFFNRQVIQLEEHLSWWEGLKSDKTKQVWIIESLNEKPIGVIQFYNIDHQNQICFWSSHASDALAAISLSPLVAWCKLEEQAIIIAELELRVKNLYCETLARNSFVLNIHHRFGFSEVSQEPRIFQDRTEDVIVMSKKLNPKRKAVLLGSANWDQTSTLWEKNWNEWFGEPLEIIRIPFGQYKSEIFKDNGLLDQKFDFLVLAERLEDLSSRPFSFLSGSPSDFPDNILQEYINFLVLLRNKVNARIYVFDLFPLMPVVQTLAWSDSYLFDQFIAKINLELSSSISQLRDTELVPLSRIVRQTGQFFSDPSKYHAIGRFACSFRLGEQIGKEIASREIISNGLQIRCLIVDLDNTLWGGVLGEDRSEGIGLSNDYPDNLYVILQEALSILRKRGIVLAIASKNDEADALSVIENHPFMVLKNNDFVAYRIGWQEKIESVKSLAQELNLGLSSLAFLDDSPYEREMIRQFLPDVLVMEWPDDFSSLPNSILFHHRFQAISLTEEDLRRTELYKARTQVRLLETRYSSREAYLADLGMCVDIVDVSNTPSLRTLQLLSKTNQFNTTTRRHGLGDLAGFAADGGKVFNITLKDKLTPLEIVGVLILLCDGKDIIVESYLMSCRALGRDIEKSVMLALMRQVVISKKYFRVVGQILKTERNRPAQEFYPSLGFVRFNGYFVWDTSIPIIDQYDFIKVSEFVLP